MNIPERIITLMELRRNSGERGACKWIAFKGIVYVWENRLELTRVQ